jgi:hypothetical protein
VRDRGNPTSQLPPGKDIATWPTLRLLRDSWRAGQTASSIRRMLAGGRKLPWTRRTLGRSNHRVARSTPAMRRFRDVAYVPSLIEPAALRGGGLFLGARIARAVFWLSVASGPCQPIVDVAARPSGAAISGLKIGS